MNRAKFNQNMFNAYFRGKSPKGWQDHLLYFLFPILYLSSISSVAAQPLMRDVFAAMPDSVLPMVTKNNRLDCIDFIENNMEAKVRNVADENVTLEALTNDYARFRTSASAVMELKLLPVDTLAAPVLEGSSAPSYLLCIVNTIQTGEPDSPRRLEDSNIRFLWADWSAIDPSFVTSPFFSMPELSAFLTKPQAVPASDAEDAAKTAASGFSSFEQALRSLQDFHPIRLSLSPDAPTLSATLQPAALSLDERKAIQSCLQNLTLSWDGNRFVLP